MGWDIGCGSSRMDAANDATRSFTTGTTRVELIKRVFRGNVCYSLHRITTPEGVVVMAGVTLLRRFREGWGFKAMGEDDGPHYFGLPAGWLAELTYARTSYSREWRERVARVDSLRREQGLTLAAATRFMLQEVEAQR